MKQKKTTFWHLSDLHLEAQCDRRCTTSRPACHACIKAALIERLAARLERERPHLLLLAGDLFEDESWKEKDNSLEPLLRAAKRRSTVVVGIRGQHDPGTRALQRRYPWILGEGGTNADAGVLVRALPGAEKGRTAAERTRRTLRALSGSAHDPRGRPSVLLAHINAAAFLRQAERQVPRFRYYALGDMHLSRIVRLADGAVMGTPGHLYSYFDGSGKVWPTYMLKGSFSSSGDVEVSRVALQDGSLGAPQMRQVYIPRRYHGRDDGQVVLVNAPEDDVLKRVTLRPESVQHLEASGTDPQAITLRRATFSFGSAQELRALVRGLLEVMPRDVFVGLARGKGRAEDRWRHYGACILRGDLEDFVQASLVPTSKTQTSDTEGWTLAT